MSRYIDADEFENFFNREEWRTPDEKWWPEREIGLLIDLIKTSDVIPIEWVKEQKNKCFPYSETALVLNGLLTEWEKEKRRTYEV